MAELFLIGSILLVCLFICLFACLLAWLWFALLCFDLFGFGFLIWVKARLTNFTPSSNRKVGTLRILYSRQLGFFFFHLTNLLPCFLYWARYAVLFLTSAFHKLKFSLLVLDTRSLKGIKPKWDLNMATGWNRSKAYTKWNKKSVKKYWNIMNWKYRFFDCRFFSGWICISVSWESVLESLKN